MGADGALPNGANLMAIRKLKLLALEREPLGHFRFS
jgi:hypothetical protein